MATRTVAIQLIRAAIAPATDRGLDVDAVLRAAGIPPGLVAEDAARVTEEQAARLIQVLWVVTGDEMVGLGPMVIPRGTFRMVTLGLIHTPDLRTALQRLIEFVGIGIGFDVTEMAGDASTTKMIVAPGGRTRADQVVGAVGIVVGHRFANWLIGRQIPLTAVELPEPAPAHADYPSIFGVTPIFDAPAASIAFDSGHLDAPVVRNEDELIAFLRNLPTALLFRQDYHPATSSRVRRMLERRPVPELVGVEDVARPLNVSGQHLRRLLREEGTTFREIKDVVLRDAAIDALVTGRETTEELSDRLGFSEPSAFRRAFRRWTGSPPGAYRLAQG
ncbi:AraC family transcriptional regulator [Mycobacterium yunnanensis]|uniref:AraC family transcriptional regulator n=1 Tax=Mycobacterium yunnanensis TaxID=368477 RepID=A0A9X3C3Q7_9MYCO|nr:AraC family transcriptional regulator [Mycobacterium yunnanensis]MCV7422542.1 AraC family transcriptional regulator [Mycobacterium yunnanensis]